MDKSTNSKVNLGLIVGVYTCPNFFVATCSVFVAWMSYTLSDDLWETFYTWFRQIYWMKLDASIFSEPLISFLNSVVIEIQHD